ncbi:thyrotropin-releasing hormone-degrading ectoenzyme-like [Salvelinus sp. IW2-2015]|uniref:thyrotropin-releasing hormone-degrading ectoenzyme-like n=1 Tax=Salvelinus sp. IW2-2015 TaxID=2691554 RepID=UPI000CEB2C42|nr:thyrotropin-releasing hormone-degrading ectoenzyme-like [Salvelinus alpinus]
MRTCGSYLDEVPLHHSHLREEGSPGGSHLQRQGFLLNRLLNLSLSSDLVPDQDVIDVIIHVGRNPHGRHLAWRYFREKWDILNSRYGEALFMNSKLISGVTEFLNTDTELNELKEFIQISGGGAGPALARAVEIVEANVRWHSLYQRQIFQWLRKSPNG